MNSRAPVALAMGVGYLLGRTHKMRWALLLGTAAATGRLGGVSTQVLERGADVLRSSPELAKITDSAGRLVDAGRAAAVSAMSSRVESLSSTLADRAHGVGETGVNRADEMRPPRGRGRSGRGDEEPSDQDRDEADEYAEEDQFDDDEYEDDEYDEGEPDQDDEEDQRHERAPEGRRGSVVRKARR
ncbi:MAG TPA: hypothetical protein VGJ63_12535 [Micromonosporaceae bacterium]|jgi:hypothetical protein